VTGKTAVLGFGNPVRADDGVGPWVIGQLRARLADDPTVTLLDMGTSTFDLLFALRGHDRFICVDAVTDTGHPPGTIFQPPVEAVERPPVDDGLVYLHGLKWTQALAYARRLLGDAFPRDVQVWLVAVDDLSFTLELTPPVAQAGATLVDRIAEELCSVPH
jgi:hydrogenase maturation protease